MPINSALLVSAAVLQNTLIDKNTGLPLSGGVINLYQDQSRQIRKNWYQQIGTYGNYSYIALPNPLTLSAAGKIVNDVGIPIIPFFYPYSEVDNATPESYYIQIFNSVGQEQDLIQNFPFNPQDPSPASGLPTLKNYIDNPIFYSNIGSINVTTQVSTTICLSASAKLAYPDIQYFKNVGDGLDTITFEAIPAGTFLTNNNPQNQLVTPITALRIKSSAPGTATQKYISIPLAANIKSLESTICSYSMYAINGAGQPNNQIQLAIYQFAGTGVNSSPPIIASTFTVTNSAQYMNFQTNIVMPSAQNVVVSDAGDDGLYLQIYFPTTVPFDITVALPLLYIGDNLGSTIPTNEYISASDVYPLINSARTGQKRISVDSFIKPDEIRLDDGTIGNSNSGSLTRANSDTWFLYKLLWTQYQAMDAVNRALYYALYAANAYGTVATGTNGYGVSAYADFIAGKQLQLIKTLSRVTANTVDNIALAFTVNFATSTSLLALSSARNIPTGTPVYLSGAGTPPAGLEFGVVYYAIWVSGTQIRLSYSPNGAYNNIVSNYLIFTNNGTGALQLNTGYQVLVPFGEGRHKQIISELAAHAHLPSAVGGLFNSGTLAGNAAGGGSFGVHAAAAATGITGASYPFNVVQPTIFEYHFIHL